MTKKNPWKQRATHLQSDVAEWKRASGVWAASAKELMRERNQQSARANAAEARVAELEKRAADLTEQIERSIEQQTAVEDRLCDEQRVVCELVGMYAESTADVIRHVCRTGRLTSRVRELEDANRSLRAKAVKP